MTCASLPTLPTYATEYTWQAQPNEVKGFVGEQGVGQPYVKINPFAARENDKIAMVKYVNMDDTTLMWVLILGHICNRNHLGKGLLLD